MGKQYLACSPTSGKTNQPPPLAPSKVKWSSLKLLIYITSGTVELGKTGKARVPLVLPHLLLKNAVKNLMIQHERFDSNYLRWSGFRCTCRTSPYVISQPFFRIIVFKCISSNSRSSNFPQESIPLPPIQPKTYSAVPGPETVPANKTRK